MSDPLASYSDNALIYIYENQLRANVTDLSINQPWPDKQTYETIRKDTNRLAEQGRIVKRPRGHRPRTQPSVSAVVCAEKSKPSPSTPFKHWTTEENENMRAWVRMNPSGFSYQHLEALKEMFPDRTANALRRKVFDVRKSFQPQPRESVRAPAHAAADGQDHCIAEFEIEGDKDGDDEAIAPANLEAAQDSVHFSQRAVAPSSDGSEAASTLMRSSREDATLPYEQPSKSHQQPVDHAPEDLEAAHILMSMHREDASLRHHQGVCDGHARRAEETGLE